MMGALDQNYGTHVQAECKNLWDHWVNASFTNIFKIKGKTVFAKMNDLKQQTTKKKTGSKRDRGGRNHDIIFPINNKRHTGYPISKWEDKMFETVQDDLLMVERIPEGTPFDDCSVQHCCDQHPLSNAGAVARKYDWHAQFQKMKNKYVYAESNVEHYVCGAFRFTDHHGFKSKKPKRRVYICPKKETMKRHLWVLSPHANDLVWCRALMLSILYLYKYIDKHIVTHSCNIKHQHT